MSREQMRMNIAKAEAQIAATKPDMEHAVMRQKYHFMAEQGWINDPNGLIFFRGKYHFFYQYNPYDAYWGAMHWGHAISDDMLHWEYLPIALAPSEPYDDHKEGGCFSGSSIEHEGKLYLVYTGTTNYGDGFIQSQCVACSEDGVHFDKFEGNPVIPAPPEGYDRANFRDPKVWKHDGKFYLVCGAKKDNLAHALLYRSADLLHWEFVNVLAESRGELGYMWECPDFYPLGDKYVLMFSPMGLHERTTVYLVGDMNYETGKFTYATTGEIDWGFDYYAPQSFLAPDGRRILVAWANAWDWMPWWKDWGPSFKEGWCGAFNLPREAKLCEDNSLRFIPVKELETLRGDKAEADNVVVEDSYEIAGKNGVFFELKLIVDRKKTTAESFDLILRSDGDKASVVTVDLKRQQMSFDRSNADGWSRGKTRSPLLLQNPDELEVHVYVDQSSIEVYTDDYKTSHSCNVFASNDQNQNYVKAHNGILHMKKVIIWELEKTMK
ncbi:MAG: glycoside hydrolase family 32 protein [Lachnospiraceae bacterium]|nr:glycoside hydrolase family 32 protein [Lachnospiraceae bacterium]